MVDSLLALARADAGPAPAEALELTALARARIEAWQPALERGVHLDLDAPVRTSRAS